MSPTYWPDRTEEAKRDLQVGLERVRAMHDGRRLPRMGTAYSCPPDLVLREGTWYEPGPLPDDWRQGEPRLCFANSLIQSLAKGAVYVEGYAWGYPLELPVHHAWNLHPDTGAVIDSTWPPAIIPLDHRAYLGIPFPTLLAHDRTWNGDASILDDWGAKWPLLQAPFTPLDVPGDLEHARQVAARDLAEDPDAAVGHQTMLDFFRS